MDILIKAPEVKATVECRDDIEAAEFLRILERLLAAAGFMQAGDKLQIKRQN